MEGKRIINEDMQERKRFKHPAKGEKENNEKKDRKTERKTGVRKDKKFLKEQRNKKSESTKTRPIRPTNKCFFMNEFFHE